MGAVYLANHTVMGRQVAIKVIRDQFVSDREAISRFHQEVKAAAQLNHRNIVAAYDADQVADFHFLAMEFVKGESMAELVNRKGRLPVVHCCNYIWQAASGLNHAFQQNMVHRDIKPHNMMRTSKGIIKILDFGLARLTGPNAVKSELTTSGILMGTADYIAPEQARDARTADIRSDLYSLGCTFFFLLAAEPPYTEGGYVEKVIAHCSDPFPGIQSIRNDVPETLRAILQKLTAKDPVSRYQTPRELIDALAPFAKRESFHSQTISQPGTSVRIEPASPDSVCTAISIAAA